MTPFLAKLDNAGLLPPADRALLLEVCQHIRTVPARRDLIAHGERPDVVQLIVEGWACRYATVTSGARQITAFLIPGDFCDAHITLFGRMDHSIATLTECRVVQIPRAKMLELTDRPAIARALWWASLVDEATLRAWIVNIGSREAAPRMAHLLCELHARLDAVGQTDAGAFALPLTQEELGDALGLTSVHVNRTLKRLTADGLIAYRRGAIEIVDAPRLRRLAGFDPDYLHLRVDEER